MFEGIFTQKIQPVDEIMPYPPSPMYPSGLYDSDKSIYTYAHKSSDFPNLIIVDPISDVDGNIIQAGFYGLILSDDRKFLVLVESNKIIATIPVFKLEEDKKEKEKLYDKEYQKKIAKEDKARAKQNAKLSKRGVPPEEKQIYMNAGIEYEKEGGYYLIKYERGMIRAWGAIKG